MDRPVWGLGVRRPATPGRIWAVTTAAHAVNPPTEADTFARTEPCVSPPCRSSLPTPKSQGRTLYRMVKAPHKGGGRRAAGAMRPYLLSYGLFSSIPLSIPHTNTTQNLSKKTAMPV